MAVSFELAVRSSAGVYEVRIGAGLFAKTLADGECGAVIADRYFAPSLESLDCPVVYVDATEDAKTLAGAERVMLALQETGVRRGMRVLAVGGGVVQDLATLVTALYMRGVPWVYAPTTLMAMADSCIGGKSSINVGTVKNLAGNFYPPEQIAIDPEFVTTLSEKDVVSGLAEAAKICFCRSPEAFERYLELFERFEDDRVEAAPLLYHVLDCKRWFVEIDEFDRKERRLLNFGHTFAHALEPATQFRLPHGVAVALGMMAAVHLSRSLNPGLPVPEGLWEHCLALIHRVPDLGNIVATFDRATFERAFRSDKKHSADSFHLILPSSEGGAHEVAVPASEDAVKAALVSVEEVVREVGG